MVRDIVTYPTTPSLEFGGNVRHFDAALAALLQDLEDTVEAKGLDALAAFQIGSPYAVLVVKNEDGSYLEIINPRIIKQEGSTETVETTAYFPELPAKVRRAEKIKLMYEDREGQQHFLDANGPLAVTLQRKIDYLFGSNFHVRLDPKEKETFNAKLQYGTDAILDNGCPIVFKRDRILKLVKLLFIAALIGLGGSFFVSGNMHSLLESVEYYFMFALLVLIVSYFFYAQYEGKQYKNCSSCQIGNIIGVTGIELAKLLALFLLALFVF